MNRLLCPRIVEHTYEDGSISHTITFPDEATLDEFVSKARPYFNSFNKCQYLLSVLGLDEALLRLLMKKDLKTVPHCIISKRGTITGAGLDFLQLLDEYGALISVFPSYDLDFICEQVWEQGRYVWVDESAYKAQESVLRPSGR